MNQNHNPVPGLSQTQSTQATQAGPSTGPTTYTISGVTVKFPCKAYPSQIAMMNKVIQGLKNRQNCLLESPTGSGKTLALLCSALAWQRHEAIRVEQHNAEVDARNEAKLAEEMKKRVEREKALALEKQRKLALEEEQAKATNQDLGGGGGAEAEAMDDSSFEVSSTSDGSKLKPVFEITDDEDDDFKPKKRYRLSSSSKTSPSILEKSNNNLTSDSSSDGEVVKKRGKERKSDQNKPAPEDEPYFVPYEKKLTTHKQIAQITRELKKTDYRNARSAVLASRDHTCINPAVEKLSNKNEACRELLTNLEGNTCMWHGSAKKFASYGMLSNAGLAPAYDLEDLVAVGRKHKACPYYITRFLMVNADIIFCPYNYMIDPNIRKSMNLELQGHVIIFDEAHNMEDASREASAITLKQDDLQHAMQECEKVAAKGNEPYAHTEIARLLSILSRWMDSKANQLTMRTNNSYATHWTGTNFMGEMQLSGVTEKDIKQFSAYFEAIMAQRDKQIEGQRERGARWYDDKPVIPNQTVHVVENVFRLFEQLSRDEGLVRDDFRVAVSKDTVRQRRDGNSGPWRMAQVLSLHLWCLNPAVAFKDLREVCHSIVLTSGTLSPMGSFQSELGTPFPLKLEANHVIDKSQIWAAVVGTGPTGQNLDGTFKNAQTLGYQDELGALVLRVCEIMPHGVLCFFPSYKLLENVTNRWQITGLLGKIQMKKAITTEPRTGPDAFQEAMDNFYEAVDYSTTNNPSGDSQCGALFLAVCRGKVSEGLDFSDDNARAVICIGIPFPNFYDMQVELKREYNNNNRSRGLLAGGDWYEIQAFRALNQALGRCIRHRNDWGAILLVDDRYIRTPRYTQSLSKWIRSSVRRFPEWSNLETSLERFRDTMIRVDSERPREITFDASPQVGAVGGGGGDNNYNGSLLGMNTGSNRFSSCGSSTSNGIHFANSFSSACWSSSDGAGAMHPPNSNEFSVGDDFEFKSPQSKENQGQSRYNNFIIDQTPSPVFSKKQGRNSRNVKASKNGPESPDTPGFNKNGTIAKMFARQREKLEEMAKNDVGEFNAQQVSFLQRVPVTDLSNTGGDGNSGTGTKRPREKKIRL